MNLNYQASLEDLAEPAIRFYLRSKSSKRNRINSASIGAILWAAAIIFLFRESEDTKTLVYAAIGAIAGGAFNFLIYRSTVKRRILRHTRLQTEGKLPSQTSYRFEGNKLICDSLGASIGFALSDLTEISEDKERMELTFGTVGLCTIPLRAFKTSEQKTEFLDHLKCEPGEGGNGIRRATS